LIIIVSVLVVYFLYYKLVTFFANTLHGHYKWVMPRCWSQGIHCFFLDFSSLYCL